MHITVKTIITFNPEEEKEAHESFIQSFNMEEWEIDKDTIGISYSKTDRFFIDTKEPNGR